MVKVWRMKWRRFGKSLPEETRTSIAPRLVDRPYEPSRTRGREDADMIRGRLHRSKTGVIGIRLSAPTANRVRRVILVAEVSTSRIGGVVRGRS